ncbi:VOC family protein [uncultured Roseovarius sp.]|uniref:VOC family protein n=1 Tax=uncultured Roseovarius sp. TaxID=293344 RepID=UPI002638EA2B|nr:VOC family protein [uncultured Roseovarius sp.]
MTHDTLPDAPAPTSALEAALYVDDLKAAQHFYGTLLGLEEIACVEGRHVFFRVGATILLIFDPRVTVTGSDNADLPVPGHGAYGHGHFCFACEAAELAAWHDRLIALKIPIEADFHWPNGARSIYFRDPAGNSLEMAEPRLWD